MRIRMRHAGALLVFALAAFLAGTAGSAWADRPTNIVYDSFSAPGGYTLADYNAKWSNPYGLGDMGIAPGDTRAFGDGTFYIDDAPFRSAYDFSVYDHLKYIAISNQSFAVPALGSVQFSSQIQAATPGTVPGRVVHGTYGPPGSYPGGAAYAASVLQGQQAGAVMNMVDFATGQLFDWFIAGDTAFSLIERLPSSVTGNTGDPNSPDWVGPNKMYTQIIREHRIKAGAIHKVAIRYTREMTGSSVKYYLDGELVDTVKNVGIPLDQQGRKYSGIYPSLGPGEILRDKINSFSIGHGTFSLLDAFPFQWGWNFDPTNGWTCDTTHWASACNGSVSIPTSERLFGQGVRAHFDNFTVSTRGD